MAKVSTLEKNMNIMDGRKSLKIKIFADGANLQDMLQAYKNKEVDGFTTNPTLMRKAGVDDYEKFAREVLAQIKDVSISLEVFSDDLSEMETQVRKIRSWGKNVYVKIPVTNTSGQSTTSLIRKLADEGAILNVTAILALDQVKEVAAALNPEVPSIVSVFAGRIADTGVDPVPIMKESLQILKSIPAAELLWASTREVFNVIQAQEAGCHIITVTPDILGKLPLLGKDLKERSLDTVKLFYEDGLKAGFKI